ncbi:hypothetical protein PM082_021239 [Marasmius tenuissimus]|nr:hypothetical protein PM082_021239 [Marasmius tenuissimus]
MILVPFGIFIIHTLFLRKPHWHKVVPYENGTSIGTRTYTAFLQNIDRVEESGCFDIPITIHGQEISRPASCLYSDSPSQIRRTWLVDFNEPGCIPFWDPLPKPNADSKCATLAEDDPRQLSRSTGQRGYTAYMSLSRVPLGLNAMHACRSTPLVLDDGRSYLPDECRLVDVDSPGSIQGTGDVLQARFTTDDPTRSLVPYDVASGDTQQELHGGRVDL